MSGNFQIQEILASSTADTVGHPNTPSDEHRANIDTLLIPGLERIRSLCGDNAIVLTSGYRSPEVNVRAGGKPDDAQALGLGAKFRVAGLSAHATARMISEAMEDSDRCGELGIDQMVLDSASSTIYCSFGGGLRGDRGRLANSFTPVDWTYFAK